MDCVHLPSFIPAQYSRFSSRSSSWNLVLPSPRACVRDAGVAAPPLKQLTGKEPHPSLKMARAFAPATVANLGPGYDFLGCAVEGLGDYVTAEVDDSVPPGEVSIASITGDGGRLGYNARSNCAGIAGKATMELLGVRSVGISLRLEKGLPLGSGLGSSAASAAAAAAAVNGLFGGLLPPRQLVAAGLEAEAVVSGRHADNVAPSLMGGFVLIRGVNPIDLVPLAWGGGGGGKGVPELLFVLATPAFEAPTRKMRAAVPAAVPLAVHTANCAQAATLVAAVAAGDVALLGSAMSADCIVEPARTPLIPGMAAVKAAAMEAGGAFGCTISGAGPTAVAVTSGVRAATAVGEAMVAAFGRHGGLRAAFSVHRLDTRGATVVETKPLVSR